MPCLDALGEEEAPLYLMDSPFDEPMITRIYAVDPADGELTLRADLGTAYSPFFALAAADENVLYAAGTDNTGTLCSSLGCLLLRITLDPASTTPAEITVVGSMAAGGENLGKVTGLTFRNTGDLYAIDQDSDDLYIIDPGTAQALFLGTVDLDLHGGDLTFTGDDRLLVWTNLGAGLRNLRTRPHNSRGHSISAAAGSISGGTGCIRAFQSDVGIEPGTRHPHRN